MGGLEECLVIWSTTASVCSVSESEALALNVFGDGEFLSGDELAWDAVWATEVCISLDLSV